MSVLRNDTALNTLNDFFALYLPPLLPYFSHNLLVYIFISFVLLERSDSPANTDIGYGMESQFESH
jgi:hypothetical protein